jgi:RNA polymerase sigma-70 factor (ECF subfamily)
MGNAVTTHSPLSMADLALVDAAAPIAPSAPIAKDANGAHASSDGASLSIEEVYRAQFSFVWRSLRHLGVAPSDVEDAAQDVFVIVHGKLSTFEQRAELSTWIYGICMRVAQARRRKAHTRRELVTDPSELPVGATGDDAGDALLRREAEDLLDQILDTMPIEQRAVFTLFELEGRSSEEIGALCAIPLGTVYSRLRLAREVFKRGSARLEAREQFTRERGGMA